MRYRKRKALLPFKEAEGARIALITVGGVVSPLGKRKINRGKLGAGLKGMKIRRVGQIKGQGGTGNR